jgi:hypothetical protein
MRRCGWPERKWLVAAGVGVREIMPVSDIDIQRAAQLWVQQYGSLAVARACGMVEAMRKKSDQDGADVWLRIIVAIGTSGEPPTGARH